MPKKGYHTITVEEELYRTLKELARLYRTSLRDVLGKLYGTYIADSYAMFVPYRDLSPYFGQCLRELKEKKEGT